ncbi:hypothetical protein Tco_0045293 [Tanacetum coccineum]
MAPIPGDTRRRNHLRGSKASSVLLWSCEYIVSAIAYVGKRFVGWSCLVWAVVQFSKVRPAATNWDTPGTSLMVISTLEAHKRELRATCTVEVSIISISPEGANFDEYSAISRRCKGVVVRLA